MELAGFHTERRVEVREGGMKGGRKGGGGVMWNKEGRKAQVKKGCREGESLRKK